MEVHLHLKRMVNNIFSAELTVFSVGCCKEIHMTTRHLYLMKFIISFGPHSKACMTQTKRKRMTVPQVWSYTRRCFYEKISWNLVFCLVTRTAYSNTWKLSLGKLEWDAYSVMCRQIRLQTQICFSNLISFCPGRAVPIPLDGSSS